MKISIIILSVYVSCGLRFQGISSEDVTEEHLQAPVDGELTEDQLLQYDPKKEYERAAAREVAKSKRSADQQAKKDAKDAAKAKQHNCGRLPDSDVEGFADGCRGAVDAKGLFDKTVCTKADSWYKKCCVVWKKIGAGAGKVTDEVCVSVKEGKELTAMHKKAADYKKEIDALLVGKAEAEAAWAIDCSNPIPSASGETGWQSGCGGAVHFGSGEPDMQRCIGFRQDKWYPRCCEWTNAKFCGSIDHNKAQTKEDNKDDKVSARETKQAKKKQKKADAQAERKEAQERKRDEALAAGDARRKAAAIKKAGKKSTKTWKDLPGGSPKDKIDDFRCDQDIPDIGQGAGCQNAKYDTGAFSQEVCEGFPRIGFEWYARCCTWNVDKCEANADQLKWDEEDTKIRAETLKRLNDEAAADTTVPSLKTVSCGVDAGKLCNECEGACDPAKADCVQGYVCSAERTGYQYVEGCAGFGVKDQKYCHTPKTKIALQGWEIDKPVGLRECTGKCTADEQCASGLKCGLRAGVQEIPGCAGLGENGWGYCYKPEKFTTYNSEPCGLPGNLAAGTWENPPDNGFAECEPGQDCTTFLSCQMLATAASSKYAGFIWMPLPVGSKKTQYEPNDNGKCKLYIAAKVGTSCKFMDRNQAWRVDWDSFVLEARLPKA